MCGVWGNTDISLTANDLSDHMYFEYACKDAPTYTDSCSQLYVGGRGSWNKGLSVYNMVVGEAGHVVLHPVPLIRLI